MNSPQGDRCLPAAGELRPSSLPHLGLYIRQLYNSWMEARYRKNAGAVCSLKYHLVWCPKYRRPVLTGEVEARLRQLLGQKAAELGITLHKLDVMPDHVHLFVESDPTRCVAE